MNLKVMLPTGIFLDTPVRSLTAEGVNGAFGLLPRHVDFVTALTSGILSFDDQDGQEHHLAVMEGVLVKKQDRVWVSTHRAVQHTDLSVLHQTLEKEFVRQKEKEELWQTSAARIEAGFIRRFVEFNEYD
jgi:F-type H+-transporting ATPase subunit epsilon